jgi:sulfite exporter TauE/SafE
MNRLEAFINKFRNVLYFVIGLSYIVLGYFVIKEKWFLVLIEDKIAYIFGALLILYGLFRIYRAYTMKREEP